MSNFYRNGNENNSHSQLGAFDPLLVSLTARHGAYQQAAKLGKKRR